MQVEDLNRNKVKKEYLNKKEKTKENGLPCKMFMARNSILTDIWENVHLRAEYNMIWTALIAILLNSVIYNYIYNGRIDLGFSLIKTGFPRPFSMIFFWFQLYSSTFISYYGLIIWATIRIQLNKQENFTLLDEITVALFLIYLSGYIYYFTKSLLEYDFPLATGVALLLELTRFLMKIYAFVRSNVPRVLKYKVHADNELILYPKLSQFIYFSFAPTLVYQDDYPRTKKINWKYVMKCFMDFVAAILFLSMVIEWMMNRLEKLNLEPYTFKDVALVVLEIMPTVEIFIVLGFFILFHSWLNAFAEMMQFSDRQFYKDWWTSTSISRYYRTWNIVVQDWLYTYIYKDFYEKICPNNKFVAKLAVFTISAIFHEYVLGFAFKFFFPVLSVFFFTNSMIVDYLQFNYNILFLFAYSIGVAIQVSAYSLEYYARLNCPNVNNTMAYYFTPQSIFCNR